MPVEEYSLAHLRDAVAMVLQKNTLFSGSLRENLLWGNPEAPDEELLRACRIARAAISRPPVLILDEATSSIDTRTEALIEKGMDALMENRTVFVIAHRLSTVKNSKAILVLEKGKIIERGDHQELSEEKGRYYQLYTGKVELD